MNRSNLRLICAVIFGSTAAGLAAQQALEIIPLRHRAVEQVLPALQPLLEPGATLSGQRGQLFLRASPANAAEIRRALEALDRPSRRLLISVRFDEALASQQQHLGARGVISPGGSSVVVTAQDAASASSERIDQRVQVVEGGRAFISTGQSHPLPVGRGAEVREYGSGFEVVPQLSGERVMLDVAQRRETPGSIQRASTSIAARLGEWVEIGAVASSAVATGTRGSESHRVWVKVEELPN